LAASLGCAAAATVRQHFDGDVLIAQMIRLFQQSVPDLRLTGAAERSGV
jgi:hypothetical protein